MTTRSHHSENSESSTPRRSDGAGGGTAAGRVKQVAPVVIGGALLVRGLGRRSLRGAVAVLLGTWLLFEGLRGSTGRVLSPSSVAGGRSDEAAETTAVSRSVTVGKPAAELYDGWRDPDNLSRIMGHFAEITSVDADRIRWSVDGPRGRSVSWDTTVVEEEPGESLRWETSSDARVANRGTVRFSPAPGDRGTVVTLSIQFDPPGGALGTAVLERLDVLPETLVGEALRRFKSLSESGEILTLDGNPSARGKGDRL